MTNAQILKLWRDTRGTTLVLVTHDRELTQQASRTIRLRGGKMAADSNASAISQTGI